MNKNEIEQFKITYERYRAKEEYQKRVKQSVLTPLFRDIIRETLKNEPITNKHLTGLIQMFKYNCQPKSFETYLNANIQDAVKRGELLERFKDTEYTGYTGAGLSAVTRLTGSQLQEVKDFLLKAFDISDEEDAMDLCAHFDQLNIPQVRTGIYSPWLHYINPELFPLSNNSHIPFRSWIGMPPDYPSCIRDFNQLARIVGEKDLGRIDSYAHNIDVVPPDLNQIEISGHNVFKISMSPATDEVDKKTFKYCLANNIIIMGGTTKAIGKSKVSQHEVFRNEMKVGDYFYLCRGNQGVILLGRITGDWSEFSLESFKHKHWIQRPYKVIVENQKKSTPYQKTKKHWTPNFNSTFIRIPENEIEMANDLIFKPYFKTEFKTQSPPQPPHNLILFGPPDTGKTYHTVNEALKIIDPDFDLTQPRDQVKRKFNGLVGEGRIVFATFHQSMSYEDFVEGIKPVDPGSNEGQVSYRLEKGIFKSLCLLASEKVVANQFEDTWSQFTEEVIDSGGIVLETPMHKKQFTVTVNSRGNCIAQPETSRATSMVITKETILGYIENQVVKDWKSYTIPIAGYLQKNYKLKAQPVDNSTKPFVLIIDEINRGNVSQIFGELITLIEPDKRAGMSEALEVVLPYSKQKFSVPPNLHIIGTMNTADRSVEALDTALRRRFSFKEMPPRPELIETEGYLKGNEGRIGDIDVVKMLETINKRLERLIDKDHCIGHSYFMHVKTKKELEEAFTDKVIPLLQEYFFGDFGKIGLVLGHSFVLKDKETQVFASFAEYGDSWQDLAGRPVYSFQPPDAWDFKAIYQ